MNWRNHDTAVSHFIASPDEEGLKLHVRAHHDDPSRPAVLFVHGATFASRLYDIPAEGASWLKAVASAGFAAYAMDVRGYGKSHSEEMSKQQTPYATSEDAVKDIQCVVNWIAERHQARKIHLIGGSWGSITTSIFTAAASGRNVATLVLYAPIYAARNEGWLSYLSDPSNADVFNPAFKAARLISENETRRRWDAEIPDGANWRDETVFQALVQSTLSDDPSASLQSPPAFRVPNGTLCDLWEAFNARALYDPKAITCPTLLIRGGADQTSTRSDALTLFDSLSAQTKRYVEIANGAHFMSAERRAREVFSIVNSFLKDATTSC